MSGPPALNLPGKTVAAVILVLVCGLFFHAWMTVELTRVGFDKRHAINLARLVFLPCMTLACWSIVRERRLFLGALFDPNGLTRRLIVSAILVGLLARILSWSEIAARVSFGLLRSSDPGVLEGPWVEFRCPPADVLLVAVVTWWILIPISEEFIYRGLLLSTFAHRGKIVAVVGSAVIFALMHNPDSYVHVFLFGLVFGIQYWNTKTLWAPMISHATYDGMIPFDVLCLQLTWNPSLLAVPLLLQGIASSALCLLCIAAILLLISERWVGTS